MTWLLLLVLLHPDGSVTQSQPVRMSSEAECQAIGQAWAAAARGRDGWDVVLVRCVETKPPRFAAQQR